MNKRGTTRKGIDNDVDPETSQTPSVEPIVGTSTVLGTLDQIPLPADTGKSMGALIATFVAGIVLTFLVSKGYLTDAQTTEFKPLLESVVVAGVALVTHRFLKSRSDVKVAAIHAAALSRASAALPLLHE